MRRLVTLRSFRLRMVVLSAIATLTSSVAIAAAPAQAAPYPEYPYDATDYDEAFRGQFHFSSQGGWMNDVNAPLYYNVAPK
ncbi:MAG: fructan beta-fructosidase [Actinomycetota bacterium]|nr:fructan beta-fructosidase [Actinomycetota bacterium]